MSLNDNISTVYFLGIGGIGMSALARYFSHMRLKVAGYDRTPSAITDTLSMEGIDVHFSDLGPAVSRYVDTPGNTLVILTPAVPDDHNELLWLRKNHYRIVKRAWVLGQICLRYHCLAVSGTHGKTTVSTMAANILAYTPEKCGAILGGISRNFNTNLLLPIENSSWMVTEADEYDRSFLQLSPDIAVITSMDADHLDIYSTYDQVIASFNQFIERIRPEGSLLIKKSVAGQVEIPAHVRKYTYSVSGEADFVANDLILDKESRCYMFRLKTPGGLTPEIKMNYPGILNVENAIAAGAAAFLSGAELQAIHAGLENYQGVKRRFDILYKRPGVLYIDDYAHHPEELKAFITSVKLLYPDKEITGIFQPHLYSRTRDFAEEFAASLDLLNIAVLLPIYPAREKPIKGVSSAIIWEKMKLERKFLLEKEALDGFITENRPEVLLTMGAGDIDLLAGSIIQKLADEKKD